MLKALEEIGHGAQIAVVDASYDIPKESQTVDYQGDSSASALKGILNLVPTDNDIVIAMGSDEHDKPCPALKETYDALGSAPITHIYVVQRLGEENGEDVLSRQGFYAIANNPEKNTLFVRTRDEKAY